MFDEGIDRPLGALFALLGLGAILVRLRHHSAAPSVLDDECAAKARPPNEQRKVLCHLTDPDRLISGIFRPMNELVDRSAG